MNKSTKVKWLASLGTSVAVALSGGYLIAPHEGEVRDKNGLHVVYLDPIGIPTYCNGLTGKDMYGKNPVVGKAYTDIECDKMFVQRIKEFEKEVDRLVKVDYSSDYQKAALISFAYNTGVGNLASSTLLRKLNAGDHIQACEELSKWVYANKKKLKGLVTRREEERQWCLGNVPYEVKSLHSEIKKMRGEEDIPPAEVSYSEPTTPTPQTVAYVDCHWFTKAIGRCS